MLVGWLLASATLHALALIAIPGFVAPQGGHRADSLQASLTSASAFGDAALQGLNEATTLQAPPINRTHSAPYFDDALVEMRLAPSRALESVSVSSLEEMFEKDAQLLGSLEAITKTTALEPSAEDVAQYAAEFPEAAIKSPLGQSPPLEAMSVSSLEAMFEDDAQLLASLETIDAKLPDVAVRDFGYTPSPSSLAPTVADPSTLRGDLVLVASFEDVVTAPVTLTWAPGKEVPVPVAKPANIGRSEPAQTAVNRNTTGGSVVTSSTQTGASDVKAAIISNDFNALIALLHDEIARNKHYPALARRQHREGTATVSFALYPDGVIEDIKVVSSSGYGRLDKAASSAVSESSPFGPATHYLQRTRHFRVDVVFSLK